MNQIFQVNPDHRRQMDALGIDCFAAAMAYDEGRVMREARGRKTIRVDAGDGEVWYLKRHFLPASNPIRSALDEFEMIGELTLVQVQCPELVAVGSGNVDTLPCSFLITRAVPDGVPLDSWLAQAEEDGRGSPEEMQRLSTKLAAFARRFHDTGYHHKDFYLCHIFVHREKPLEHEFVLIDLQRVSRSRLRHRRWVVKDLAALNYSTEILKVTLRDRLRFVYEYLGIKRLDADARRLIRDVADKTNKIRRHDAKLLGER